MPYIEVTPAYGKDYANQKEVRTDWNANVDFQETSTGSYVNKSQAERLGLSVIIRYANNRKVMDISRK